MAKRRRLDLLLVDHGLVESREKARALIMAGEAVVEGQVVTKPAALFPVEARVSLRAPLPYVSRGGFKLAKALDEFGIDVTGLVAIDVGASTGGFTDCLLQRGARRVYAVDVGYGQLDYRLRNDPRVVVMDRTNIRYLESLPEPIDLATIDVSFISLEKVLPAVMKLLKDGGQIIALIKPQFEAGRDEVGKGGVVRDPGVHRRVIHRLQEWSERHHLLWRGLITSPILGAEGNKEFLAWLEKAEG